MVKCATDTETRDISVEKVLEGIRTGGKRLKGQIEQIRNKFEAELDITGDLQKAKRVIDPLKKQLPGVTWSGRFSYRASDKLLQHSGLLGADLVKPQPELLLAYDDPLGVTAAFNRNLLVRVNRELDGDFDVNAFAHRAVWNAQASRIEMHLVSRHRQRVQVRATGTDITFDEGEPIWTESSYKYRAEDLAPMLGRAGFGVAGQWQDRGFALTLAEARA
jgi:uncharacterized SAM-dependent methyltransferase